MKHPHSSLKQWLTIVICCLLLQAGLQAQPSEAQRIQDSVLGWWSIQNINNIPKVHESHGHTFTVKTQMDMKAVIEWMKKSYIPVGGLGYFKRQFYVDGYSNQPHSYGIDFRVWSVDFAPEFLDEKGHFKPVAEEYISFGVDINTLTGINAINYMSSPTRYVFTWQPDGFMGNAMDKINNRHAPDPRLHPNVSKYLTRITENDLTVYLVPNNTLPLVPLTKGAYLQMASEGIDRKLVEERAALKDKWPGNIKAQDDAFVYIKNDLEKYRVHIKKWMELYKDHLNDAAVVRDMQPNIRSFDLDPFVINEEEKRSKHFYPVYMINAATLEKCRLDQPQWVAVSFPVATKEDGNQAYELYRAMLEHFNYEYLYNYYFNPVKIKGIAYQPVNESLLNATLDGYRKKGYWKKQPVNNSTQASNILLMDDFNSNEIGGKPAGWYFSSTGNHSTVTTVKDLDGKWVQLGYGNEITPTVLKKPLPANFTLEYDVTTSDFTYRTGGSVVLNLDTWNLKGGPNQSPNRAALKIEIGAGNENDFNNNNYRGYLYIDLNKVPEVNESNYNKGAYYKGEQRMLTNQKRKVHVVLKIKDGHITLFINNTLLDAAKELKLAYGGDCKDCTIPAGMVFNQISWKNTSSHADEVSVYISKVKLTKE